MKRILILLSLIASTVATHAQISGHVQDSESGKPITQATITIIHQGKTLGYALSRADGSFEIKRTIAPPYTLRIRHISYGQKDLSSDAFIALGSSPIRLNPETKQIKDIVVRAASIAQRGDTVTYRPSAFVSRGDITLEDALKKMPGIRVSETGTISYQGKAIDKLTIDGSEVTGDRYTLATQILKHNKVKEVQLRERQQEIKALKGLVQDDKLVMNIVLTQRARISLNGRADLALGIEGEKEPIGYLGATAMAFRPKRQYLMNASLNKDQRASEHARQIVFYYDNPVMISSSIRSVGEIGEGSSIGSSKFGEREYTHRKSAQGSINVENNLSSKATLRVEGNYQGYQTEYEQAQRMVYFDANGQKIVGYNEAIQPNTTIYKPTLKARYMLNDDKVYIGNTLHLEGWFAKRSEGLVNNGLPIEQIKDQQRLSLYNSFSFTRRIGASSLLIATTHQYDKYPRWMLQTKYGIQRFDGDGYSGQANVGYNTLIFDDWSINLRLAPSLKYERTLGETDWTGDQHQTNFGGIDWATRFTLGLSKNNPNARLSCWAHIPIVLRGIKPRHDYIPSSTPRQFVALEPMVHLSYRFSPIYTFAVNLQSLHTYGGLSNFFPGLIYYDYRNTQTMFGALSKEQNINLHTSLSYRNPVKELFGSLNLSYGQRRQNLMVSDNPDASGNTLGFVDKPNTAHSYSINANISKYIRSIQTKLDLSLSYTGSQGIAIRSGIESQTRTNSYSAQLDLNYNPTDWLEITYSINTSLMNYKIGSGANDDRDRLDHAAKLSFHPTKELTATISMASMKREVASGQYSSLTLLGAKATWKLGEWILGTELTNLLNQRSYAHAIYTGLNYSEWRHTLRPRSIALTASYYF